MQIEIKNVYGKVLYIAEVSDDTPEWRRTREVVEQVVSTGADLTGARLSDADLSRARLTGAHLSRADLTGADLTGARLSGAHLTGADLTGAHLSRADLTGAAQAGARLSGAHLRPIKADLWMTLTQNRHEVAGLRAALVAGEIDGAQYSGACACLKGTIANIRGCSYTELEPDASDPAECWFMAIRPGHTPENSSVAALTLEWIDEWLALNELTVAQNEAPV